MRVCGLTERTEVPETTAALDILAENRYLDHVRTVTELVSRRLQVEPRPLHPLNGQAEIAQLEWCINDQEPTMGRKSGLQRTQLGPR